MRICKSPMKNMQDHEVSRRMQEIWTVNDLSKKSKTVINRHATLLENSGYHRNT